MSSTTGPTPAQGNGPLGQEPPGPKKFLLRLNPDLYGVLEQWAADELRSVNAQIEFLLRQAARQAGRLPRSAEPPPPRGQR